MKALILSGILLSIFFTSCKDDKSEQTDVVKEEAPFTITVNAVVDKDSEFQIYYNEDGSENYPAEQYVNVAIKGSQEAQDLVFKLPNDVNPMNLRFDLGSTKELMEVKFNSVNIDFKGKKVSIPKESIFRNFYPNTQVVVDTLNATAKINVKEGELYDPIVGATPELKRQIETLYAKKVE
jgi:hypothetical protein